MKKITPLTHVQAVRKRPGMYFGEINSTAVNVAIYEAVANSIDQFLNGSASKVSINIVGDLVTVVDDGNGLPFLESAPKDNRMNKVESYFVNRHDAPTADGHAPHIHVFGGGLGLAVLNAGSESIEVESSNGNKIYKQKFGKGKIQSSCSIEDSDIPAGTKLRFVLDKEIFEDYLSDLAEMRKTLFELSHFYPGLIIEFQDERFVSNRGLSDLALIKSPRVSSFQPTEMRVRFDYSSLQNDVHLQVGAVGTAQETEIISWVNGVESIDGGSHVIGLKAALEKSGWTPRIALIHIVMHDPRYARPVKDELVNPEIEKIVENSLKHALERFVKSNID